MMAGRRAPRRGAAKGGIEPPSAARPSPPRDGREAERGRRVRDAAVAATGGAQVRAAVSLPVFRLLAKNDCSPGFKAV